MFEYKISNDISLRPFQKKYQQDLFELVHSNQDHLSEWLSWVNTTDEVSKLDSFLDMSMRMFEKGDGYAALIYYNNNIAGFIGHQGYNSRSNQLSLGYWLGKEYMGKGIMTKACKVMIDYAIKEMGCHRVEIKCADKNKSSRAIPERLGFTQEGIIRDAELLNGTYVNHVVYGILEDEWNMDA